MSLARAGGEIRSNIFFICARSKINEVNEVKEFTSFTVMYVPVKNWIDHQHGHNIMSPAHQPILSHCCYIFLRHIKL